MSPKEEQDRLDRWLRGELSAEEEAALRKEREGNEDLEQEMNLLEDLEVVAGHATRRDLKARWQQLEADRKSSPKPKLVWRRWVAVAAVGLLLITAGLWFANRNYSNKALFAANYDLPNFSSERGAMDHQSFQQAADAFYRGDYPLTLAILEVVNFSKQPLMVERLRFHSALQIGNYELAATSLEKLPTNKTKDWLTVLLYLKTEDTEQVRLELKKILDQPGHPYLPEAEALNRQFDSPWRLLSW